MNNESINFKRIKGDSGLFRAGDWFATHTFTTGPQGKAVTAPVMFRVRKTEYHGRAGFGSLYWTAEVIVPGSDIDGPLVFAGRYGSTRHEAVRNALKAYRDECAAGEAYNAEVVA